MTKEQFIKAIDDLINSDPNILHTGDGCKHCELLNMLQSNKTLIECCIVIYNTNILQNGMDGIVKTMRDILTLGFIAGRRINEIEQLELLLKE